MQETDVLDIVYRFTNPILIVILGYFLRSILQTIKKLQEDFSQFRVDNAGQRIIMQEHKERLEKIENKLDQYDRDFKIFYMEYGSVLKKAKRDFNH
jgi:N-glycosylase/DNA lyase